MTDDAGGVCDPRDRVADGERRPLPSITRQDGTTDREPGRQDPDTKFQVRFLLNVLIAFTPSLIQNSLNQTTAKSGTIKLMHQLKCSVGLTQIHSKLNVK